MVDHFRTGGMALLGRPDLSALATSPELKDRALLMREINIARAAALAERQVFLVVINIADTKNYDEIIRVFGYKFADDLVSIRLADLGFISNRQPAYRVGFWSVGLIFHALNRHDYESALERLIKVLAQPVICRGVPVTIDAGVGICDLKRALGSAEDLLQATYLAGQAATASHTGWVECNYDLAEDHRRAFALVSHAASSLAAPGEFFLVYQARVDLLSGQSDTAEAYLRWNHPTLGLVMPEEFVPVIEMTGLVRELTGWILAEALAQTAAWHEAGRRLKICLKLSARNLNDEDFVGQVEALLAVHRLPPDSLELEFSETFRLCTLETVHNRLTELRDLGVGVSIDEFGAGINGLATLETIPATVLKIDRRLINSLLDRPRQQVLVKSIIRMAHDLDMKAVAEGVETPAVKDMLVAWHCDFAEGFLFNRPEPAAAFMAWFEDRFGLPHALTGTESWSG